MSKWLLLDGFNLAFRAFYGMPELTRKDGFPTGAIHGWIRTIWRLADDEKPDGIIVTFDSGGSTRHETLLPDYKAQRSECPEPLGQQIPYLKKLSVLLGCSVYEEIGIEADDIIGALALRLSNAGDNVKIVSADKDLAQCIKPGVSQLLPPPTANPRLGWRNLDREGVINKFGVPPEQIPDYLALIGDTSDNIPGLPGVGPKTATKWLIQFGNLETIIAHCGEIKPVRFQGMVHQMQEDLRRNLILTTLETNHEVKVPTILAPKVPELIAQLKELEMNRAANDAGKRYSQE